MKSVSSRAVAVVVLALSLLTGGFSINTFGQNDAHDDQQREKPKMQKPEQKQDQEDKDDQTPFRIGAELVVLDVTVVDPSNKPVMDLTQDNFQVTEDKVPQKIEFFSREQVPVSLVFAIDTSGSMRAKLDTVIKASVNLVKESRKDDEIAVIEFKDQPELLEEFTTNIDDVIDTLQGLIASRQTAMLDALYLGADYASKEGHNRRKAIILVTDGLDKDSYYKFNEVVDHLRETDVQVYLIGFTNDLEKDGGLFKKSPKDKAESLLNKLAEETGGKAFFPKELSDVHAIAQQISTDLRTQYSIGYYPTNSKKDGTFRSVKVAINAGNRRLVARTRNGYVASPRTPDQSSVKNQ
ncbi:MAG TPA: VWA domain-containing protein [Blastocatellia bacterium]|nr:VWA domain-containing protein [Blastocatellia bacterium]